MANELSSVVYDKTQIDLIKDTICQGATDNELKLFIQQCERTGLDPFARQIYSIERSSNKNGKYIKVRQTQISIDGERLIAERTGKYGGQLGPYWCGNDGVWKEVWLSPQPPAAAKVGVIKTTFKEPMWGVAVFSEYCQKTNDGKLTKMWAEKPSIMIAKCAEALALRKAFPQELSGLYTTEEMDKANEEDINIAKPEIKTPKPEPLPEPEQEIIEGEAIEIKEPEEENTFDEIQFLINFKPPFDNLPYIAPAKAKNEIDSLGHRYEEIPTENLMHRMNSIINSLQNDMPIEKRDQKLYKLSIISTVLMDRKSIETLGCPEGERPDPFIQTEK